LGFELPKKKHAHVGNFLRKSMYVLGTSPKQNSGAHVENSIRKSMQIFRTSQQNGCACYELLPEIDRHVGNPLYLSMDI